MPNICKTIIMMLNKCVSVSLHFCFVLFVCFCKHFSLGKRKFSEDRGWGHFEMILKYLVDLVGE